MLSPSTELGRYLGGVFGTLVQFRQATRSVQNGEEFEFLEYCMANQRRSTAQLFQDLFVLWLRKQAAPGYFVEFGATDGVMLSNTLMLEQALGWHGIVCEPARVWHANLHANRRCVIDTRCVWTHTGETLEFIETDSPDISTIKRFSDSDCHAQTRRFGKVYDVTTVSLADLLTEHGAPERIDYMSVDTEGSEFDILNSFDFDRFDVRILTVEHNFTDDRQRIHDLLREKGYVRRFELFSNWDDWYVKQ